MTHRISFEPQNFGWATGIEDTFVPQTRPGLRSLDEYDLTQHYQQWKTDYDLAASSGVQFLRVGIPWYRIQPDPSKWDWSWSDQALEYLVCVKGITPILDLMHYGTPSWLENSFVNNSYPEYVAEYAFKATERYRGLVTHFTPLNEPSVNAIFCGERGIWPPYLYGNGGFIQMIAALAKGIISTTRAVRSAQPDSILVQVEALWHHWTKASSIEVQNRVAWGNERQYLCYDLCTGCIGEDYRWNHLLKSNGIDEKQLEWFQVNRVNFDIFGANFYPWSYGELIERKTGKLVEADNWTPGGAIGEVINQVHSRYGLPVMVTETSARRSIAGRGRWMDETIAAIRNLRLEGVPVVGYTWFPLFTMIDWEYRTGKRALREYLLNLGLYEADFDSNGILVRQGTSLVERYQSHIAIPMPEVCGEDNITALPAYPTTNLTETV